MGLIGKVLQWANLLKGQDQTSEAELNRGGGRVITTPVFSPAGEDSQPLANDYAAAVTTEGNGRAVVVGYSDPTNERQAQPGEVRRYARRPDGTVAVQLFLHADGSAELFNDSGRIELMADGEVRINGARITRNGRIVDANGIGLDSHRHGGVTAGQTVTLRAQP